MQFSFAFVLSSLAGFVLAQNPFLYNPGDLTSITAGSTFTIAWAPSTGTTDTITILLRQGDPSSLITVLTIASSIPNTGSYTWAVPSTLVNGDLYTFEIYDDKNHDLANYSNQFTIVSTNTVSSVIAQPVATTTGKDGFASTIYGVASVSATEYCRGQGGGDCGGGECECDCDEEWRYEDGRGWRWD